MTAFVFGVIAASTVWGVTQNVAGSTSQKTGVAPVGGIASALREKGERGNNDLIARPDAERPQRDRDRLGAVCHADRLIAADVVRELLLERLDFRPRMYAVRSSTRATAASISPRSGATAVWVSNRGRASARTLAAIDSMAGDRQVRSGLHR